MQEEFSENVGKFVMMGLLTSLGEVVMICGEGRGYGLGFYYSDKFVVHIWGFFFVSEFDSRRDVGLL